MKKRNLMILTAIGILGMSALGTSITGCAKQEIPTTERQAIVEKSEQPAKAERTAKPTEKTEVKVTKENNIPLKAIATPSAKPSVELTEIKEEKQDKISDTSVPTTKKSEPKEKTKAQPTPAPVQEQPAPIAEAQAPAAPQPTPAPIAEPTPAPTEQPKAEQPEAPVPTPEPPAPAPAPTPAPKPSLPEAVCNTCGAELTYESLPAHGTAHMLNGENFSYYVN